MIASRPRLPRPLSPLRRALVLVLSLTGFAGVAMADPLRDLPQQALAEQQALPEQTVLTSPVAGETAAVHPALWKITRGASTIYLFGTVHALPQGVMWFAGPVAKAFDSSGELVTEIIDRSPEEMRPIVAATALLPQGQNLRDELRPTDRLAFERTMRANGLAVDAFDRFRPWYAAVALSTRPLLQSGYDPAHGADEELSAKAVAKGRAHKALETAEYQLGLFAALPRATQLGYLREVVRSMPEVQRELHAMVRAWAAGDANRLARLMNEDDADPHLREVLLLKRNRVWARWIQTRLASPGVVFVAVGAGHLARPGSVLAQLRGLGIRAARVQ